MLLIARERKKTRSCPSKLSKLLKKPALLSSSFALKQAWTEKYVNQRPGGFNSKDDDVKHILRQIELGKDVIFIYNIENSDRCLTHFASFFLIMPDQMILQRKRLPSETCLEFITNSRLSISLVTFLHQLSNR